MTASFAAILAVTTGSVYVEKPQPPPAASEPAEAQAGDPEPEESPFCLNAALARISAEHGLPPKLVQAIIQVESRGDPRAVSPKGAKGLMQLMPSVLKAYQVEDPFDPLANLEAGVRHLKYLLGEFSGNLSLALAAYNAGPANVKKYRGIPPFPETQKYLFRVLREYQNEGIFPEPLRQSPNRSGKPARPESAGNPFPAPSRELHASLKSPPPAR